MSKELLFNQNPENFKNFVPYPFWSMDRTSWLEYADSLSEKDKFVLDCFPFKWAYAPPCNADTALEFLHDICVDFDRVTTDDVENIFKTLPTFEDLRKEGKVEFRTAEPDEIPANSFRMIPEWEPMAGAILNFPSLYPPLWETSRSKIKGLDHAKVYLRIPEGYFGAAVLAWLKAYGIDLDKIQSIPGPIGDIWARDYSPVYGVDKYTGKPVAHKFSFAAFYPEYRDLCKSIVDIDNKFAWTEGYEIHRTEIMIDGGYVLTDGNGTYIFTRRVLTDNAHISNLYAKLEQWLGAERLIIVDEEPDDPLGHINHFKMLGPNKMLIGLPEDTNHPWYKYYANLTRIFEGYGYEIYHVPCPTGLTRWLPDGQHTVHGLYANSLMVNGRILMCQYGGDLARYDEEAIACYKKALPGIEVVPIDCSIIANGGGAINCSTKELPDYNNLNTNMH